MRRVKGTVAAAILVGALAVATGAASVVFFTSPPTSFFSPPIPGAQTTIEYVADSSSYDVSEDGRFVSFLEFVGGEFPRRYAAVVLDRETGTSARGSAQFESFAHLAISPSGQWVVGSYRSDVVFFDSWSGREYVVQEALTNSAGYVGGVLDDGRAVAGRFVVKPSGERTAFAPLGRQIVLSSSAVTNDGRYITYESPTDVPDLGDVNTFPDVFLYDTVLGTTTLITKSAFLRSGNGDSVAPHIAGDGSTIAFMTQATDLVERGDPLLRQLTYFDLDTESFASVEIYGEVESISDDGDRVVFRRYPLDSFRRNLFYVRSENRVDLIRQRKDGGELDSRYRFSFVGESRLSGDGRTVVWFDQGVRGIFSNLGRSRGVLIRDLACDPYYATVLGAGAITGTSGDDVIVGSTARDVIDGGGGNDVICGIGGDDEINGSSGDDVIIAGPGNDRVRAGGGDDQIFGGPGSDNLGGDAGRDMIDGGSGDDTIFGGSWSDVLDGSTGADTIYGNEGTDRIVADPGDDTVDGGLGIDVYDGTGATGSMRAQLSAGFVRVPRSFDLITSIEEVWGTEYRDTLLGSPGPDRLYGFGAGDVIAGLNGDDRLYGGLGADAVFGGRGNDIVRGGNGNDNLRGDDGNDRIFGGTGHDTASYNRATGPLVLDLLGGTATGQGSDTLIGVENLVAGEFDDELIGGPGVNRLDGRGGTDGCRIGSGDFWVNCETVTP